MNVKLKKSLPLSILFASILGLTGCNSDSDNQAHVSYSAADVSTYSEQELKAFELIRSIETGDTEPVSYINENNYVQHNLDIADGVAGFGAALGELAAYNATSGEATKADVKRVFEYGDYVILHTEYNFFGPKAGFDIFRFENGLIVEHWDNLTAVAEETANGNTQFDGALEITDVDRTEENIAIVKELIDMVFIGGDVAAIYNYIGEDSGDYIQHNPLVDNDLSGLFTALQAFADNGTPMTYTENHIVLGEGNFVLAVSGGNFDGSNETNQAFYDLFRLENGKIVEHWDTIQAIPAESEWKNNNGKFGF